ncbi:MAG: type II toxin-antitoxin system Phd/YefM family antitoxin [Gallionella sp.]|nr:type II toxin-antitoxin system Phd/YefM family antitoxin [Gallionella sp.]
MQTINISEFRSNLLKYLESVNAGESIRVTSNGKVLATISAPEEPKSQAREQLHALARTARLHDIVSPTQAEWDAAS